MIEFTDAKGMSEKDISELETFSNFKLPKVIVELFRKCSGGTDWNGKQYHFKYERVNVDTWIIEVYTKESIIENWENRSYLNEYFEWFELTREDVEIERLFPIFSMIDGEIMIAIGGRFDGEIFLTDNGANGILNISKSIEEFYSSLTQFSLT